jgi:hypothetical protein
MRFDGVYKDQAPVSASFIGWQIEDRLFAGRKSGTFCDIHLDR